MSIGSFHKVCPLNPLCVLHTNGLFHAEKKMGVAGHKTLKMSVLLVGIKKGCVKGAGSIKQMSLTAGFNGVLPTVFKIISTGWQCANYLPQTVKSVLDQTRTDWQMMLVYDNSTDDGISLIQNYCSMDSRINSQINKDQQFAVRNQYEGLQKLAVSDEDVVVFLDLDGDQLAFPQVLAYLAAVYDDNRTLMTYGNYEPVPNPGFKGPVLPYPEDVVKTGMYRQFTRSGGGCRFNHLRTMKGKVFNSIPEQQFKWDDGRWYTIGTDYIFMMPALERAGGRYRVIDEILLHYNHDNPMADFRVNPGEACVQDMLQRQALEPLYEIA